MTWQDLLNQRKAQTHQTSLQEISDLRAVVARDLADAAVSQLSADRRFATAYNAALQLAKMTAACAGYRVTGLGHHQSAFLAAEIALGPASTPLTTYFDLCRRKRNTVDYDRAFVATETETSQILAEAENFRQLTETWIRQNYPQFAPPVP